MSALDYGRNLARAFGARLHVLHVVDVIATSSAAVLSRRARAIPRQGDCRRHDQLQNGARRG